MNNPIRFSILENIACKSNNDHEKTNQSEEYICTVVMTFAELIDERLAEFIISLITNFSLVVKCIITQTNVVTHERVNVGIPAKGRVVRIAIFSTYRLVTAINN